MHSKNPLAPCCRKIPLRITGEQGHRSGGAFFHARKFASIPKAGLRAGFALVPEAATSANCGKRAVSALVPEAATSANWGKTAGSALVSEAVASANWGKTAGSALVSEATTSASRSGKASFAPVLGDGAGY